MDKNNEKESLNLVEKALALDSKHIRAWIHKAGLLGPKEYNEKLACYDRVLEMEPENTDSPLWKAVTLYELGRHVEAFDACEKAIDIEPENPQLWFTLALILENAGRKRESISAYERFVEMAEPGFSRPANNEANRNALSLLKTQVEIVKINEMGEQPADMSVMLALLRSYYMFFNICRNELPHDNNDESE
jgi:tetratricopeptide (TPR) repeat protein